MSILSILRSIECTKYGYCPDSNQVIYTSCAFAILSTALLLDVNWHVFKGAYRNGYDSEIVLNPKKWGKPHKTLS